MLAEAPPSTYLANWRDGRVKLAIIQRMLALRMQMPDLLSNGSYLPLTAQGRHADRVIAFARRQGNCWAVVIATRLSMALLDANSEVPLIDPIAWDDTAVQMPEELFGRALFDWLSPAAPKVEDTGLLYLREALTAMPVAVLVEDGVPRV
jgi:(1->4)-alpha-D-glucan 1-alpha-D-glucosylmutase